MKISFSPDLIPSGWLGLKDEWTISIIFVTVRDHYIRIVMWWGHTVWYTGRRKFRCCTCGTRLREVKSQRRLSGEFVGRLCQVTVDACCTFSCLVLDIFEPRHNYFESPKADIQNLLQLKPRVVFTIQVLGILTTTRVCCLLRHVFTLNCKLYCELQFQFKLYCE